MGGRADPTAAQGRHSDAVRYVKNTPSCILPICAKADFEVAAGSETKRKPCSAKGVNGGELACVVAVTAIVALSSIKSPENPTEGFSTCTFRFTPCQRITKELISARAMPKRGWFAIRLFGTVNASNRHTFRILIDASASSNSNSILSSGIRVIQSAPEGRSPGSYEWGPNELTALFEPNGLAVLSSHIKAKAPECFFPSSPIHWPFMNLLSV